MLQHPKEKSDDKLDTAYQGKINYFRGSLKDVFSRYLSIAKKYNDDDLILRATADNPLPDGNLVNTILNHFNKIKNNYFGIDHKLHNLHSRNELRNIYCKKDKKI